MKLITTYITILLLVFSSQNVASQQASKTKEEPMFTVRGAVRESDTYKPISKVNIEVNGGAYTMTGLDGEFRIQVRKGDEITVRHKDFETVYYTVKDDERILIEVKPADQQQPVSSKFKTTTRAFNSLIDSASSYLKKDAEKSIQFITEALSQSNTSKQNADAYEVLADVYTHWKQYDLAVSNYRISLQNAANNEVKLKLAKAYEFNKNYQESIDA